ncbi:MAG: hypothetical protein CMJ89_19065 [Planctomycetes bacterium]|jgi:hypothetical protein|nr:hypothetical protein [Planctomycetota bacterium]
MRAFSARSLSLLASCLLYAGCGGGSSGPPPPAIDTLLSDFTVDHTFGTLADGISTVAIAITVADDRGEAVVEADISFRMTGFANLLDHDLVTDENGQATGTLASRVGEKKTLTCLVDAGEGDIALGTLTIEFVRAEQNAFFLRTSGSDANAGETPLEAWRTLDFALSQVGPSDTLYIGAGEYTGGVTLVVQADDTSPLTLYGDRDGIFTGDAGDVVVLGAGMPHGLEVADSSNVLLRSLVLHGSAPGVGLALRGTTRGIAIVDCDLYENENGIATENSESLLIESNRISNNTGNAIILGSTDASAVRHNLIYNNALSGVVLASPSTNFEIQGNTFYRNGSDHFREEQPGGTGRVTDNIFVEGGSLSVRLIGGSSFERTNNLIFANGADTGSTGDLEADPQFVDPFGPDGILGGCGAADDNYRVLSSSPALDAGERRAQDTLFAFAGPASTRTSQSNGLADGMGNDGDMANLGFHYPIALDAIENLAPGLGRLAFVPMGASFVHSRSFELTSGAAWGEVLLTRNANQGVKWVVQRARSGEQPDEAQAVLTDTGTRVELMVRSWDGRRFSEDFPQPITTHIQSSNTGERGFDLEYEDNSGHLMLVHAGPETAPLFRTLIDGQWSADAPVFDLGLAPATVLWVQLVARPGTDEMALVSLDDQQNVIASVWDGSAWDSGMLLATEIVETRGFRSFDAAWEGLSGDLLVAWGFNVFAEQTRYATRSGQTGLWTNGQFTSTDAIAAHLRLHSDPQSDRIVGIFGEGWDDDDVTASIWNGSLWTDTIEFTLTGARDARGLEAAWLGDSGEAIAIYRDNNPQGDFNFAIFRNGWHGQVKVNLPGVGKIVQAQIVQMNSSDGITLLLLDEAGSLHALTYEDNVWSIGNGGAPLATQLDATQPGRMFSMGVRGFQIP